jgi:hypothetical protein
LVSLELDRLDVDFLRKSLLLSFSRLLESSERIRLRLAEGCGADDGDGESFFGVMLVTTAISFWSLMSFLGLFLIVSGVSRLRLRLELLLEATVLCESLGVLVFRTVSLSKTVERSLGWGLFSSGVLLLVFESS